MARTMAATLVGLALAMSAGASRAQDAGLVPPRLTSPLTPSYPDGAEGDALVVLAVTVAADGSVRDVRIASGDEPFASAAIRELQRARF